MLNHMIDRDWFVTLALCLAVTFAVLLVHELKHDDDAHSLSQRVALGSRSSGSNTLTNLGPTSQKLDGSNIIGSATMTSLTSSGLTTSGSDVRFSSGISSRVTTVDYTKTTEIRSMPAPRKYSDSRMQMCAYQIGGIVRCNAPEVSFADVISCARDIYIAPDECVKFAYLNASYHVVDDVVSRYDGVREMRAALDQQSVTIDGLMPRRGEADVCEQCEAYSRTQRPSGRVECYRAVIGDHPHARVLIVPCSGEPRWQPEHFKAISGTSNSYVMSSRAL